MIHISFGQLNFKVEQFLAKPLQNSTGVVISVCTNNCSHIQKSSTFYCIVVVHWYPICDQIPDLTNFLTSYFLMNPFISLLLYIGVAVHGQAYYKIRLPKRNIGYSGQKGVAQGGHYIQSALHISDWPLYPT